MHQDVQLFRPPTSIMAGRCDYLMKHVGLVPTGVDASASDPSQSRALTVAPSDWSIVISRENDQGPSQCHRARSRKNSRPRHRLKSAMPRQNAHYQGWELLRSSPIAKYSIVSSRVDVSAELSSRRRTTVLIPSTRSSCFPAGVKNTRSWVSTPGRSRGYSEVLTALSSSFVGTTASRERSPYGLRARVRYDRIAGASRMVPTSRGPPGHKTSSEAQ